MKKDNFTSIPFPPRRLSLGSEWARPYPILGILQERSGAPELLLAWTDPDVVRRVTITFPLLLVDTTLPATVGTETCRWDGLSTPYQAKPFSVFPTPAVHGRRLSSSFEHLHQNSARLSPRKKNLSPTKDTTPTGSLPHCDLLHHDAITSSLDRICASASASTFRRGRKGTREGQFLGLVVTMAPRAASQIVEGPG